LLATRRWNCGGSVRRCLEVGKILAGSPKQIWKKVGKKSGITRAEFFAYFKGKQQAHALVIKRAWKLDAPICLTTLRRRKGGFRPPQNFHYLNRNESSLLASLVISQKN
jgi:predicted transcriptional regulator